jgi:hypothetical protein
MTEPEITTDHVPQPTASLPPPPPPPAATSAPPKRRRGMVVGGIALVMAIVAGALVFVFTRGGSNAEAVPLGLSFTPGQTQTYVIDMTMDGDVEAPLLGSESITMDVSETVTWTVKDVDAEGIATIEVAVTDMSGSVNGIAIPDAGTEVPSIEIRIAPDGRILTAGGMSLGALDQTQGFGFPGMGQMTPLLPDGAVAPGDTWTKEFSQENPFGDGTIDFTATSTYEGTEDLNGTEAAVVTTSYTVPLDFTIDFADVLASMSGASGSTGLSGATGIGDLMDLSITYGGEGAFEMKAWVDTEARQMLKMESTGTFDMTMAFTGVTDVPGLDGDITFTGNFTESIEQR